ncbi:MAG: HupE/UreJ family protein [Proteobacteria bacterium]|nr:HupE/UreJ family protein [Pseudomonadota bacterium]
MALHAGWAHAHDARPAFLQIDQIGTARYAILWRTPVFSGMRLPVVLRIPEGAQVVSPPHEQVLSDSIVERQIIDVPGGVAGKRFEFVGLQGTITDVLVRAQLQDGARQTTLVRASQPWVEVAPQVGWMDVVATYVVHGITHILLGYDHLLFVLALVLIVPSMRVLLWTITSFTLAHSITLALATLGVVHVPGPPVEATIALSILLLACEILRTRRGQPSLTQRWPWAVAFTFGLLHGFGFAGALSEIGLPQSDIPLALFSFNVGVELGQLAFIAAIFAVLAVVRRLRLPAIMTRHGYAIAASGIGVLSAFWLVDRVAAFFA